MHQKLLLEQRQNSLSLTVASDFHRQVDLQVANEICLYYVFTFA